MELTDILKKIHDDTEGDSIKAGEIVDAFKHRGYGPLLLAASLLCVLPTGAIPGVPTITAFLIILIAGQMVVGRKTPWLPDFLCEREIKMDKFESARQKVEPYTKKIDKVLKPRFEILTEGIGVRIVAALCVVLACFMPPLEVVPFAAIIPALAIVILSVGLSAKDGVVMVVGCGLAVFGIGAALHFLMNG